MSTHPSTRPIRIAIIGAGVGGLVLATALRHFDDSAVAISIYEAQAAAEESGAGIGCFGKSVQVICRLGLADEMADIATCHPRDFERLTFRVRKADCEPGWTFATRKFGKGQTVHRTPFLNLFRTPSRLPPALFHYGKRLVSYSHGNSQSEITLAFADGSTATCDLLVGCDGIRSAVRRCMFLLEGGNREEDMMVNVEATWSGSLAYRALFPMSRLPPSNGAVHPIAAGPTAYCGQNKGTMVNMVMYVTPDPARRGTTYAGGAWVADATADEILEHYAGWEEEVQSLLSCLTNDEVHLTRWAIHEVPPVETYVRGRVVLLGDAAHAMQPHSGSGANQTIEDAYMLARLLYSARSIDDALRVYDAVRRPYTQAVAASSARAGEMLQSLGTADGDAIRALGAELETFDEWHKEGDVEADVQAALRMLRDDE